MARKYEGSAADEAEDARGAKALGISKGAYEKTGRDKAEDKAGEDRVKVRRHTRARRAPPPPPPPPPSQQPFGLAGAPGEGDDEFE